MEKLILNDGTELPAHAILASSILWVYLDGSITLAEAFELLINPEKTERIVAEYYGDTTVYEGYTDLFCIRREADGSINAGLGKAVV